MIVSHKHRYIFIKPRKVAGTSVMIALAKSCGIKDTVIPLRDSTPIMDGGSYTHVSRNYEGFFEHMTPAEIQTQVSKKIWDSYTKIVIARNPWDMVVSRYTAEKAHYSNNGVSSMYSGLNKALDDMVTPRVMFNRFIDHLGRRLRWAILNRDSFSLFMMFYLDKWTNEQYYYDSNGKPYFDFLIRFEYLQKDYNRLCDFLEIPQTDLPRVNTKLRKHKKHYSEYHTRYTIDLVKRLCPSQIKDYTFNRKVMP